MDHPERGYSKRWKKRRTFEALADSFDLSLGEVGRLSVYIQLPQEAGLKARYAANCR
jgi:hypothetical protein